MTRAADNMQHQCALTWLQRIAQLSVFVFVEHAHVGGLSTSDAEHQLDAS